jgi:alanine racemase
LKPALKLTTKISAIRRVGKGESVGYKRTYTADGPKKIAVLPIGYSDGYPRSLSGKAEVLVTGQRCKIVGLICMNAMMADVTGIPCALEDEVVLIGEQGKDKIYADELAKLAGTNTHEILAELSPVIAREYKM